MRKQIGLWLLSLAALALVVATPVWGEKKADGAASEGPEIGKAAPAFELPGTDGATHKLEDFKGKIVVLHFQGIGCPWEKAYQPILNDAAAKFAPAEGEEAKVVFLAINSNKMDDMEGLKACQAERPVAYSILKDEGNKVADAYSARTTPHIYIIDAEGVLRYRGGIEAPPLGPDKVGQSEEQYLVPVLEALTSGSEPPVTITKNIGCSIKRG